MSTATKKMSGTITSVTPGTPVVLGTGFVGKGIWLHAPATNTGIVYIGNDGADSVSSTTGFSMDAGNTILLDYVFDLSQIYVDSSASSQKVTYIEVETAKFKG
jgi:hypothetical protein